MFTAPCGRRACWLGLCLACVVCSASPGQEPRIQSVVLPSLNAEVLAIETTLAAPAQLDLVEVSLAELPQVLRERRRIAVAFDEVALREMGLVPGDLSLTGRFTNVPLRTALALLLWPLELDFTIRDEQLLITSRDRLDDGTIYPRFYAVGELVAAWQPPEAAATGAEEPAPSTPVIDPVGCEEELDEQPDDEWAATTPDGMLIRFLTEAVAPESWHSIGGYGDMVYFPPSGVLVVVQNYRNHVLVEQILSDLTYAVRQHTTALSLAADLRLGSHSAETFLDRPANLQVKNLPLGELVDLLAERGQTDAYYAPGLEAGPPGIREVRLSGAYAEMPLERALRLLLLEHELDCTLWNGVAVIGGKEEVAHELLGLRYYDVGPIIDAWDVPLEDVARVPNTFCGYISTGLIGLLERMVESKTWEQNGGQGTIAYCPPARLLVVQQTHRVHRQVEDTLRQLLAALQEQP